MQSGIKTDRYFVCNSQDKLRICGSYIRGTCAKMKHKRGNNDTNGPKRPQANQLQKKKYFYEKLFLNNSSSSAIYSSFQCIFAKNISLNVFNTIV